MAGLELHARDLARLGQLVLDNGIWGGKQLLGKDYIQEMLAQSQPHYPPYGLLWWRLPSSTNFVLDEKRMVELADAGVARSGLDRLQQLVGRTFTDRSQRDTALEDVLGPGWRERIQKSDTDHVFRPEYGEFVAYYADGYLGQTLMVIPGHRIVAVRQVKNDDSYAQDTDVFSDFKDRVFRLVAR